MVSKQWNNIVTSHCKATYYLSEWGKLLQTVFGYPLVYLEYKQGVFPLVHVKSFLFGNRLISLPFADYGGPCAADENSLEELIGKAEEAASNLNVDFVELRMPEKNSWNALEKHGFVKRNEYVTFVIDLDQDTEKLWQNIGGKNRNMVRNAQKSNVKIVHAKEGSDVKIFYRLYLKTMKRLGSPPQPLLFFETMWNLFYPGHLLISMAKVNNTYVASDLFFLYKDRIHYAYGCSVSKDITATGLHNLLLWDIIEWGNKHGFQYLDLGRTREGQGTMLFKKRWGGEQIAMPYFYKFYKKELKQRQELTYKRLSNLWARAMPEPIANRIGPWIIKQIG
ncbi:GNAT family N-acetyltransferase [Patescibacteria group bacterium]|nr:GNAT family N-acetyltransferase [Patescibacteria group bacterium]